MKNSQLAEMYMPLAESMARSRSRNLPANITSDEIRSAALFGLSDAAHRFDPDKGVPFACYARIRIAGEITESFRGAIYDSREPEDVVGGDDPCCVETEDFFDFLTAELGESDGKLLRMYYLDGKSLKEAGRARGVSESRASQILKNCHARLKKRLKKGVWA
jgi:RNA polymerase sigma factor (sigma-70 family)